MIVSLLTAFSGPLISLGVCQMAEPYVIAGRITALYMRLAFAKVAPHVEVEILMSASDCLTITQINKSS